MPTGVILHVICHRWGLVASASANGLASLLQSGWVVSSRRWELW